MHLILEYDLEALKTQILQKAEIHILEPALFKTLSLKILWATKKRVSETTLKRIFGKVANTSKPSLYTLNVLAEYCGYHSWDAFCKHTDSDNEKQEMPEQSNEASLISRAREISQYTLQALKNKSGIPYHLTISRDFLEEHFEIFLNTEYHVSVLAAPAGYGKTIGLCHWVESQLNYTRKQGSKDIILFLSARVFNKYTFKNNLNQWLLPLLGIATDKESIITSYVKKHKYYLIIDGFDTTVLDQEQWDVLFDLLHDVIAAYQDNPNFKVVLTMRSSDWINLERKLRMMNKLENWFLGFVSENADKHNFYMFAEYELKQLINKINPNLSYNLDKDLLSLFSYPLFFQYYYQEHSKNLFHDKLNAFGSYEVIYNYILEKVYTGRYSTEKVLLINTLLEKGQYSRWDFSIDKLKVYDQIKEFTNAYHEMISIGIIREMNLSGKLGFKETIEFVHKRIGAYFIAAKLIYDNNGAFDNKLIERITEKVGLRQKLYILKWTIFIALKNQEFEILDALPKAELIASEKATLIGFLTRLIKDGLLNTNSSEDTAIPFDRAFPDLFNYILGVELISSEYLETLETLLTLKLSNQSRIFILVNMAISNILNLDSYRTLQCINELKKFSKEDYSAFPVNPLTCIEALYNYFMFQIVNKEALTEITRFMFNPDIKRKRLNSIESNYTVYLLALCTSVLSGNILKPLRFIKILHNLHHANQLFIPEFHFFLIVFKSFAYLISNRVGDGLALYDYLLIDYQDNNKRYTSLMKFCLDTLSAVVLKYLPYNPIKLNEIELLIENKESESFKLLLINMLKFYIASEKTDADSNTLRNLSLKYTLLIRSTIYKPNTYVYNYAQLKELLMQYR